VKLHAEHGLRPVRQGHGETVVAACRDGKLLRQTVFADHERMVPPGLERAGHPVEERGPVVAHGRALAVPRRGRALDDSAMERRDGLVAEAHAEQRHAGALGPGNHGDRAAGILGPAGTREMTIARAAARGCLRVEPVVAGDLDAVVELSERLHEVVGEGVVVVDDEDHDGTCAGNHSRARSMARKMAAALDSASAYSFRGWSRRRCRHRPAPPDTLLDDRRADGDREVAVAGSVEVPTAPP
jgi:hypothetical protein